MEMLSLACGIVFLLFGLMMKTYSPSTTILRYVSNESSAISYYVRLGLDRGAIVLFFIPVGLLTLSLLVDIHRNVQFYRHHMSIEKMQLQRDKMNTDASRTADDIREWREKEEDKIGTEIALAQAEHDSDVLRITTLYNSKHAEMEKVLQDEMQ